MNRKLWIGIAIVGMAAAFSLKANAEQQMNRSQNHGEILQLQREIAILERRANPLRLRLEQIEARAKPIKEQLLPILQQIKIDREKLSFLQRGGSGERREHR